jgi:hypothetical protein
MQHNASNVICDGYLEGLVGHRWRIARSSSGVQEDGADRTYMTYTTYRTYATMGLLRALYKESGARSQEILDLLRLLTPGS